MSLSRHSTSARAPNRFGQDALLPLPQATSLMKLAVGGPHRPVDDLIDRLAQPDGDTWLAAALEGGPMKNMNDAEQLLARGSASIEQLTRVKEISKKMLVTATHHDKRLAGIAGYFLAIAAGLRHYGKLIGGRGRSELHAVLLDLASVAPEPYSTLLADAAMVRVEPT